MSRITATAATTTAAITDQRLRHVITTIVRLRHPRARITTHRRPVRHNLLITEADMAADRHLRLPADTVAVDMADTVSHMVTVSPKKKQIPLRICFFLFLYHNIKTS